MNENKIKAKASVTYFPLFILFFYTFGKNIYIYFLKGQSVSPSSEVLLSFTRFFSPFEWVLSMTLKNKIK